MATDKNPYKGWVDADGFTTKDWKTYQAEANKLIQDLPHGGKWQDKIEAKIGKGLWELEDKGKVPYNLNRTQNKKTGVWSIKRKQDEKRAQHLAKASDTRKTRLENANVVMGDEAVEAGKVKQKEIQTKPGRNADHIIEVQTFGPAQELLEEEYAKGAISKAEYDKRLQILKDSNIGDSAENFQDLSESANQVKKNEVYAKNKSLEKLEKGNPSLRHLKDKYADVMRVADNYKVTKYAKKTTKLLPWLGTAVILTNLNGRVHAAVKDPSAKNLGLAGLATADAVLEGLEYATGGLALPITTLLQAGIIGAETVIEDGTAKISTASRRSYRHGNR